MSFSTLQAQTPPNVTLGDPILHLDATTLSLTDGVGVQTWTATVGPHAIQATEANQPKFVANALNGKPGVEFDRTASNFLFTGNFNFTYPSQPNTIFLVKQVSSLAGVLQPILSGVTNNRNNVEIGDGNSYQLFAGTNVSVDGAATDDPVVLTSLFNGGSSALWVNSSLRTLTPVNPGTEALGGVRLGTNVSLSGYYGGFIFEVLVYDGELTEQERKAVEGYLMLKWFPDDLTVFVRDGSTNDLKSGHTTIQDGVDAAAAGDIVEVSAGTYTETVTIDKELTVTGDTDNPENVIIDGNGTGTVVTITAGDVTFEGFTVQNSGGGNVAGIALVSVEDCLIQNNIVKENAVGIAVLENSQNNKIQENVVEDNSQYGVYVNYSASNTSETIKNELLENVISGSERGIYLGETAANTLVKGNEIYENTRGVLLFASDNNTFVDNVLYENAQRAFDIVGSQNNEFTGNDVIGSNDQSDGFVLSTGVGGAADGRHSSGNVLSGNQIANHPNLNVHSTGDPLNGAIATCNYWGTENITNIAAAITGPVMWAPYLIQDADGDDYPWDAINKYVCSSTAPYVVESGVAYPTIQAAVDAAEEDETVVIPSGWYGNDAINTLLAEDGLGFKFGASPGCVGIGESMLGVIFSPTNKIYIDIEGNTHCYDDDVNPGYDQVFVNFGMIDLGGAELIVNLDPDFTPQPGDQFHIFISNSAPILGVFSNPLLIKANNSYFVIQYNVELPDGGYAVTLTTVAPTFKLQINTQQVPN